MVWTRVRLQARATWAWIRPRLRYEALRLRLAVRQAWTRLRGV
jgi:hypothetical protein